MELHLCGAKNNYISIYMKDYVKKELRLRSIKEWSRKDLSMNGLCKTKFKWHNNYGSTHPLKVQKKVLV